MTYPFENLVFKAGGVKGIAYGGAVEVLANEGILPNIKRIAGTSAGSITAAILALDYTSEECSKILQTTDFASFMDGGKNPFHLVQQYGLYKGDAFLEWMQDRITESKYGLEKDATFRDFHEAGCRELFIFATNLNKHNEQEFSFRATPDVPVAEACRASMSIPGFFGAWKFPGGKPDNHIYVDGGVLALFPLTIFDSSPFWEDEERENPGTLGLHLSYVSKKEMVHDLDHGHFFKYVKELFETGMRQQQYLFENDPEQVHRTIQIDTLGIGGTKFDLSKEEQQALIDSGKNSTLAYLESYKAKHIS